MKKILRRCVILFLALVFAVVLAAIFRQETYPSDMKKTVRNAILYETYQKNGSKVPDAFTHEPIDHFDYDGNMQAKHLCVIPAANQLQISVRYGLVAQENLQKTYELPSLPPQDDTRITFRLRALKVTDDAFTLDDKNLDEEEILSCVTLTPSVSLTKAQARHMYRRFVFDGIDFDTVNCAYLDMMFEGQETPFSSIIVYHKDAIEKGGKAIRLRQEDCLMPNT